MANYFQPRNLTALREMALLWLADQVEVALQRYRADQQVTDIWETRERVVVALTGRPGERDGAAPRRPDRRADRVGRAVRGARAARRRPGRGAGRGAGRRCAGWPRTSARRSTPSSASDVPTALLEFARGVDATQLVLGTSRRSRATRVLAEGIGVARRAGLRAHRRAHGHPPGGGPRDPAAPPVQRRPGLPPGSRAGRWACCCRWPRSGPASSAAACSGCPPTSCCSSSPPWSARSSAGWGRPCSPRWPAACCSTSS